MAPRIDFLASSSMQDTPKFLSLSTFSEGKATEQVHLHLWRRRWEFWALAVKWWHASWTNKLAAAWLLLVIIDGAILFLAMVTALRRELSSAERDTWVEVTSQVMNALFMVAALATHPSRLRHLWLYGTQRALVRKERGHPAAMPDRLTLHTLLLLNLNNFSQYILAGFMWGYPASTRPVAGVMVPLVVSFSSGAAAGVLEHRWIAAHTAAADASGNHSGDGGDCGDGGGDEDHGGGRNGKSDSGGVAAGAGSGGGRGAEAEEGRSPSGQAADPGWARGDGAVALQDASAPPSPCPLLGVTTPRSDCCNLAGGSGNRGGFDEAMSPPQSRGASAATAGEIAGKVRFHEV
ncbi:unnamed protein product [Phaeothamnion confervicola]